MKEDILLWLAANQLECISPQIFLRLYNKFGGVKETYLAKESELKSLNFSSKKINILKNPNLTAAEKIFDWCQNNNCKIITFDSIYYPALLKEIKSPPLVLFVKGNFEILNQPQIAIVGSRNASFQGLSNAKKFAINLSRSGLVLTSGLALGIDSACHQGALKEAGKTIAVLGSGLGHIYPKSNIKMSHEIVDKAGALVSEFNPFDEPKPYNFPRRNRIIAGLSLGVLVVEAALKSGSLITAKLAIEEGREVFAIPGSIQSSLTSGCHSLIKDGAKLVESVKDILEELDSCLSFNDYIAPKQAASQKSALEGDLSSLIDHVGFEVTPIEAIIQRSGLTASKVSSMLLALELHGCIKSIRGGYVRLSNI